MNYQNLKVTSSFVAHNDEKFDCVGGGAVGGIVVNGPSIFQ